MGLSECCGVGEYAQARAEPQRARRKSSMLFATQTVQVTSEATARPIMTAFAVVVRGPRNMPHGERSCGSCARLRDGSPADGLAELPFMMLV